MRSMIFNGYLKTLKNLYIWLAVGFFIYIVWRHSSDFRTAVGSIESISLVLVAECLSLALLSYYCRALRWLGYMRLLDDRISMYHHNVIYLSGFAFTASPGKVGELIRGVYLDNMGVPFRWTFLSFLSERLLDVISVLLLGTYFFAEYFNSTFAIFSVALLVLPFIFSEALLFLVSLTKSTVWLERIKMAVELWETNIVLKSQVLTLLAWSAQGLILFLMLVNFDVEISVEMAVSIYCLSLLIGAASLIPSGIGVTEVGMIWLLSLVGVESDIAIITSLITRMLTLWPAMIIGVGCALVLKKKATCER